MRCKLTETRTSNEGQATLACGRSMPNPSKTLIVVPFLNGLCSDLRRQIESERSKIAIRQHVVSRRRQRLTWKLTMASLLVIVYLAAIEFAQFS